jgi:hypothetical protein
LAIASATLIVISASCGGVFAAADGIPDSGATDVAPGSDTADGNVLAVDANEDVDPDGGSQEAATRDGATAIDAAGCTCDCDQDGFQPSTSSCDGGPGPRPDCDDLDDLVKPTSGFVAAAWTSPHAPAGDWNCDGVTTKQHDHDQKCNDPNNCNGKSGFDGNPSCGETAPFNTCQYNPGMAGILLPSCKVGSTAMATQACE